MYNNKLEKQNKIIIRSATLISKDEFEKKDNKQ